MVNKKINILVIGGSGFIGSHVVDQLVKKNFNVFVFDLVIPQYKNKKAIYIKQNIKNLKALGRVIKKCSVVYNFAGIGDIDIAYNNPISTIENNILINSKIIELCIKYKINRFVYASSIYALSDKGGFYRCSKQAAENYLIEYGKKNKINYTILRFGSLYGPRSGSNNGLYKIINNYYKSKKLSYFGTKLTKRNYIYVVDAAKICSEIIIKKYKNKIVQVTGKQKIYIFQVMKILSKILNYKKTIFYQNLNSPSHYENNPYTYKIDYGVKKYIKNEKKIDLGLNELVKIVKK